MVSTFHGLEVGKRGMMTHQAALYTTGHNIANANTPGYSRQRVNFETTEPYPPASRNRPHMPGQLGTGVKAGDIQRIRDSFVDMQFRGENSKLGYWESKAEMLAQMEHIMNEPTDTGLAKTMDQFWNALQDLAVTPQNDGARRVVRQRGIALADTFNYMSNQLKSIQKDYRKEIDQSQDNINSILRQINQVNKQIGSIEPHGYLANDLYDERDRLVDELSRMVNIKIEVQPSGGLASPNAEGLYNIYLATPQGDILMDNTPAADGGPKPIKLIDAVSVDAVGDLQYNHIATGIHITYENRALNDSPVTEIKFFQLKETEKGFKDLVNPSDPDDALNIPIRQLNQFSDFNTFGRLKGYIEGYGYIEDSAGTKITKGLYNDMLADLDEMAFTFAKQFNLVHSTGWSLNDIRDGAQSNYNFFDYSDDPLDPLNIPSDLDPSGAASRIKISQDIRDDVGNIAAAAEGNVVVGSFGRTSVETATVGNPTFSGIYKSTTTVDSGGNSTPKFVDDENEFVIELTFDEASDTWSYTLKSYKEGVTTPVVNTTATIPAGGKITVKGIEIDTTLVKPSDGSTIDSQSWEYRFSTEGIKADTDAFIGNGSNALALANVKDVMVNYGGSLTNVHSFYQGMVGTLGDQASEANRMYDTSGILRDSVEHRRMSISNVSLDEEMTNMIKFQHAYNAAARTITMVDEMLDRIINNMGLVGR